jgi:hypothetical protein
MVAAVLAATGGWLVLAAGVTDPLRAEWRRSAGDPAQACFDFERASLAMPAAVNDRFAVVASDASAVTIRYEAHDADGVPTQAEAVCALRDGSFSVQDTVRRREHAQVAERLDRLMVEFDCLNEKKSLLQAGKVDEATQRRCPR